MHESGMIRGLVKQVEQIAAEYKASQVGEIQIWLGAFSNISAEHFREHFDAETPGTLLESCELEIETSTDIQDPNAQHVLLKSVDLSED